MNMNMGPKKEHKTSSNTNKNKIDRSTVEQNLAAARAAAESSVKHAKSASVLSAGADSVLNEACIAAQSSQSAIEESYKNHPYALAQLEEYYKKYPQHKPVYKKNRFNLSVQDLSTRYKLSHLYQVNELHQLLLLIGSHLKF
uniref:Uncharacterized protein n=1 Tax=Tetranychus urticae TaxID=32264 RepID=T1JX14_TETUR